MIGKPSRFRSSMADLLEKFQAERAAFGFSEKTYLSTLRQLDRLWSKDPDETPGMTREWYKVYLAARWKGKPLTQLASRGEGKPLSESMLLIRACQWRQLALYFQRQGMSAYVPERHLLPVRSGCYLPFIYTMSQLSALFTVADAWPERKQRYRKWYRYWSPGIFFRLMYGTGVRSGEALTLCRRDFNPETGMLSVYGHKNRLMRYLPLSESLAARLNEHLRTIPENPDQLLFASGHTRRMKTLADVNRLFRILLPQAGLPPRANGHGPRMHDLRHTFAVHNMERWIRTGENIENKIPVLAAYMGHTNINSTYYYLRLVEPMFPDLTRRFGVYAAGVIPKGGEA